MATEGLPRAFDLKHQNKLLRIEDVVLHHALEADAGGRISQHVWVTAKAVPEIERETMNAEVDFILWQGENRVGACDNHELIFDADREAIEFAADNDLRIGQNVQVDRLELLVRIATTHRFAGVDLEAAPFDPAKHIKRD